MRRIPNKALNDQLQKLSDEYVDATTRLPTAADPAAEEARLSAIVRRINQANGTTQKRPPTQPHSVA